MRSVFVLAVLATLASSACSDETGILVHTTARAEIAEPIHELRYYVGANVLDNEELVIDELRLEPVELDGRDIRDDPFRLMIRPEAAAEDDAVYSIGVVAYDIDHAIVGVGFLSDPVGFVKGSVTQWDIQISGVGPDGAVDFPDDCFRWEGANGTITIGNQEDNDCDGADGGDDGLDCDDTNAGIGPNAPEVADGTDSNCDGVCDGAEFDGENILDSDLDGFTSYGRYGVCSDSMGPFDCNTSKTGEFPGAWDFCDNIDSDCDGMQAQDAICFAKINVDQCVQGTRPCTSPSGPTQQCEPSPVPSGTPGLPFACGQYAECEAGDGGDPFRCLLEDFRARQVYKSECSTWHSGSGTCSGGTVDLAPPNADPMGECSFQILGPSQQQGYVLSLAPTLGGDSGTVVNECLATLSVETTDAGAAATVFITFTRVGSAPRLLRVDLTNDLVADCEDEPGLVCDAFGSTASF
jgi:hypothetical protein